MKPPEFGEAGAYWDLIGWRQNVRFTHLRHTIRPASHMDVLGKPLPRRYAPLRATGAGLQNVYLTQIPEDFAGALLDLIGAKAHALVLAAKSVSASDSDVGLVQWEEHELHRLQTDNFLPETERTALVLTRRGQGLFKRRRMEIDQNFVSVMGRV